MKFFKNWTNEDFTFSWNGKPTTIKKGKIKKLEDYLAYHAAKHLVDRELNKERKPLVCGERDKMIAECFVEVEEKKEIIEKKKGNKIEKNKKKTANKERPFAELKNKDEATSRRKK